MPFLPRLQAHLDPCGPRNSTPSAASDRSKRQQNITSCFQAGERVNAMCCLSSADLAVESLLMCVSQVIRELMSIWE